MGNATGGHYHAYIRDVANEGEWSELMNKIQANKVQKPISDVEE